MTQKCPHCNKVPYPVKNEDGTTNWKNVFRIDWISLGVVIGILLIILGVKQINAQCFDIVEHPCDHLKSLECPEYGALIDPSVLPFAIANNTTGTPDKDK